MTPPTTSRIIHPVLRITPFVLFFITLLVYLQLIPYLLYTWAITGDEPHYLLAAHSLVYDHDLDLANNYAQQDYASFYPNALLDPHVRIQPDGTQLLSHDVGLSLLIAPAYAWGGREGVMAFFALLGAGLATQMFCWAGR